MSTTLVATPNELPAKPERDFFAESWLDRNSWMLSYAAVLDEARNARYLRVTGIAEFIKAGMNHYEQLSGFVTPAGFQTELALQVLNNSNGRKFWSYGPLPIYLAERVPESYYMQLGITCIEELVAEIQMSLDACLIWVLCQNSKMREDVAQSIDYYRRGQPIPGYSKTGLLGDGVYQDTNIRDAYGEDILSIRLHLFPDFIPNQGNVAKQIGLIRRKGAIEYGILAKDMNGKPLFTTEYRTMAWGYQDARGDPWMPCKKPA